MEAREADEIITTEQKGQSFSQTIIRHFLKNPAKVIAFAGSAIIFLLFIIVAIGMFLK